MDPNSHFCLQIASCPVFFENAVLFLWYDHLNSSENQQMRVVWVISEFSDLFHWSEPFLKQNIS